MKFGAVPIDQAEGAISAHSVHAAGGTIRKGQFLLASDIDMLRMSGIREIVVARLEADDLHEDEAAQRIASVMAGTGVRVDRPFTGRVNLFAESDGIVRVDAKVVTDLNRVHEGITIATLADFARVEAGRMIATIKIIPYAVPQQAVADVVNRLRAGEPLVSLKAFRALRVGLVATTVEGTAEKVLEKTRRITFDRIASLGGTLGSEIRCAHKADEIANAVRAQLDAGYDIILVFGASATIDRRDVVPSGIVAAGGTIDHFGMPVDPGNLLLLAHIGSVPVIGAPGCARSPKANGFDWVLERIAAGITVAPDDVISMGAGGLLMEIETRPQPRRLKDKAMKKVPARIAAIVLAAGRSSRMGGPNKLLQELHGEVLVRHAVRSAVEGGAAPLVVVTGHMASEVSSALAGLNVKLIHNPHFADGLSTSLRAGLEALPDTVDGAFVFLGDMPRISPELVGRMTAALNPQAGKSIVVPVCEGKRGNPVLFSRRHFAELKTVPGDIGARHIIAAHEGAVAEVEADANIFVDVDTPQALQQLRH